MKKVVVLLAIAGLTSTSAQAAEWLVKTTPRFNVQQVTQSVDKAGNQPIVQVENLNFAGWYRVVTVTESWSGPEAQWLRQQPNVQWVERNRMLRFVNTSTNPQNGPVRPTPNAKDPIFATVNRGTPGLDPMLKDQWGLRDTGLTNMMFRENVNPLVRNVVAVIDTGIDYNHPDLNHSIWTNPGESGIDPTGKNKATNGVDDDNNGYVDDLIGWDFVDGDNLPYDRTSWMNPGHGTHCSGVIAGLSNNSIGIAGIAPTAKIMPLRFLGENGSGTLAGAVKAVKYAVDNGAWILSNSWGGAEEDDDDSRALREVFAYVQTQGRLTIAAAGNSTADVDRQPTKFVPASYNYDNMLTVASTTSAAGMSSFSNYGKTRVHLGAPGSAILSTVTGGKFTKLDGTSMAAPHVSGAAALYWAKNPTMNFAQVRAAILSSVTPTPALTGKVSTGGRLNIEALMKVTPTERRF